MKKACAQEDDDEQHHITSQIQGRKREPRDALHRLGALIDVNNVLASKTFLLS